MRRLIRHYSIDTFTLWAVSQLSQGMVFERGMHSLFIAGAGLMAISLLAKPVINLLLLPLNLVTFGVFRWVSSAIVLYLVTLIIKDFKIVSFTYGGLSSKWFDVPALHFEGFMAYIGFAFMLSLIGSFIYWVTK